MKKNIYQLIISFLAFSFICMSCSDLLDAEDDGRTEYNEIFSKRFKIQDFYNSCLSSLIGPDLRSAGYCDEGVQASFYEDNTVQLWYDGQITANSHGVNPFGGNPWESAYYLIRRCNLFLEHIQHETAGLSEEQKAGWIAEVYAMRGYYYWQLAKRYGGVPIFTEVLAPSHNFSGDKRATFSEVIRQVLADCEKALEGPDSPLGYPWGYQDRLAGHLTRAGVYAVMSQAMTYAVSPLWDDGTFSKADATAVTGRALYECLSNGYELFTNTSDEAQNAYALYFLTIDDQRAVDKETIYRVGGRLGMWSDCGLPSNPGQLSAGYCPTQNLVDCYEMQATGLPPVSRYSDNGKLQPVINTASGYDPQSPYVGRDPRFEASIYYNGAIRKLGAGEEIRDEYYPSGIRATGQNEVELSDEDDHYKIVTRGGDPFVYTTTLAEDLDNPPSVSLVFEYKTNVTIPNAQFFYCTPNAAGGVSTDENIRFEAADDWTSFELDLNDAVTRFGWGQAGHSLRFDVGTQAGYELYVRNLRIHVFTPTGGGDELVETFAGGNEGIRSNDRRYTPTGYYIRKYNHHTSRQGLNNDGAMRMFRLAELYLNFAETAYQSHGPDVPVQLGPGISMSARDAVNAVRERAGMPGFPEGMSVTDFEQKYRNERRIEFAFEGQRPFDVRRWKILNETDRFVSGMRIEKTGEAFNYIRFGFEERRCNTDKFLLFPLNLEELYKIREQTGENWQNPGWDY